MKQFVIISLLLIVAQMINCDSVTFAQLVQSFNTKAKEIELKLKTSLDFMVNISEQAPFIICFHMYDTALFTSKEEREKVLAKLPKNMSVQEMNAIDFLRKEINSIEFDQKTKIPQLKEDAMKGLNFAAPSEYDEEYGMSFDSSYTAWNEKPAKESNLKNVKKYLDAMLEQHEKLLEKFYSLNEQITESSFYLNTKINACSLSLKSLLTETRLAVKERTVQEVVKKFTEIKDIQARKIGHMQEMKFALSRYNIQRIIWARFIIGLEKTPRLA